MFTAIRPESAVGWKQAFSAEPFFFAAVLYPADFPDHAKGIDMKMSGAPRLVVWAEKIRKDRLKVWQETSPEVFTAIAALVNQQTSADWWIANKAKGLDAVCKQLLGGRRG
jgi:hypothetical protein